MINPMTHPQSARLYAQLQEAIRARDTRRAAELQRQLDDAFYALHPNTQPGRQWPVVNSKNHP